MKYIAQIISENGNVWEFEGYVKDFSLWTLKGKSRPLMMSEDEAMEVLHNSDQYNDGDKPHIQIVSE